MHINMWQPEYLHFELIAGLRTSVQQYSNYFLKMRQLQGD